MKRNMMTRFSAGCLALLLTFGSVCSVQAAQEPAEPNTGQETQTGQSPEQTVQTGSVTVQLTPGKEGTSVADVEFFLTKVGEIQDSTYTLLPEYESTKIDLNTLTTAEQLEEAAKTLAETAKQEQGKKTDGTGQVVFEKQELGVYLLTAKDQPGYDLVSPTLLSIPTMETDETLHYDIKVEPKHTPRPAEHTAPQTGLFDATIWYLAGGVLLLVLAGGLVFAAKRHEKK